MVLHEPSGYLYLSCSDPVSRTKWTPAVDIRKQARSGLETDFFAVIDTSVSLSHKKIKISNLPTEDPKWRGLNLVGLDVVESATEPNVLWVYVINHRPPFPPATAERDGADPAVEIFRTKLGSDTFEYVRTVEDPRYIITPNDIVGKSDGSGFWVSNDHGTRVGLVSMALCLSLPKSSNIVVLNSHFG
jgi:arylesterase / paraoxonase